MCLREQNQALSTVLGHSAAPGPTRDPLPAQSRFLGISQADSHGVGNFAGHVIEARAKGKAAIRIALVCILSIENLPSFSVDNFVQKLEADALSP